MKKILIIFLSVCLLASLCACTTGTTKDNNKTETNLNEEISADNEEKVDVDNANSTIEEGNKETKENDKSEVAENGKVECISEIEYGDGYKVCILKEIPDTITFKDYKKEDNGRIVLIDVPMNDVYAFSTQEGDTRVTVLCDGYVAAFINGALVEEYILDDEKSAAGYVGLPFNLDNFPFPEGIGAEKFVGAPVLIVGQ